jgi:hypothetical protein
LRRRNQLMRIRSERLAHIPQTNSPSHRSAIGKTIAYRVTLAGVAGCCADPAVQRSIEVDLALIIYDDELLRGLAWSIVKSSNQHEANTFYRLRSIPGVGKLLALVWL